MRIVVQRVRAARVEIDEATVGEIGLGLLVFLGIAKGDTTADAEYLVRKVVGLRIFPDEQDKMNLSVVEAGGSLLIVSQFTLYGDIIRGRRPSFDKAALPEDARILYEYFVQTTKASGVKVETGRFQASMEVTIRNFGPVTIFCDTFDIRN
jgi:D-tyrosyl-tRNA(Tyr) deacylase